MRIRIVLALLLALPLNATADESLPIGQLVTREYWVVVHAAPDGLLYTIKTLDGIVVQEGLTGEILAALYPGVHDTLSHAIARPTVSKTPEAGEKTIILDTERR